jgi:2-oxo-4-hydroxy-4-carboxy-5-ureidoimidazoline decarboxylase
VNVVDSAESSPIAVADFDRAPVADAAAELMPCCSSRRWVSQLVSGRPYGRLDRLSARSDAILASLDGSELAEALAGQAEYAVEAASSADRRAYEQRFGHVFLLAATGLSIEALHNTLQSRLRNDPVAEREIARTELSKIVRRRLATAFC